MQALVLLLELVVDDAQVAAAVRGQVPAGIDLLLAVAEAGAEDAGDALVPGQLHEGLGIGNADQLGGLGTVADVVLVAVDEQVGGRAVDQLEAALGDRFPMIGRDALADDAAGHRDELIVDVGDAKLLDLGAHLLDEFLAAFLVYVGLEVGHGIPPALLRLVVACAG